MQPDRAEIAWDRPGIVGERPISVVLLIGVCLYREGIEQGLRQRKGIDVVASLAQVTPGLVAIGALKPDIVLVDPRVESDLTLGEKIRSVSPSTRIVALGVREAEDDVVRCAKAGMAAYVPRDASLADLVAVIEDAARGGLRCSPEIAAKLFHRAGTSAAPSEGADPELTRREGEIVRLIDDGLSNKQIAQRLKIEVSTVKNHVHNLLRKLNAPGRTAAAARLRRLRTRSGEPSPST